MKKKLFYIGYIIVVLLICSFILLRNKEEPTEEDYVVLYKELIDRIMLESTGLNADMDYIAIDTESFSLIQYHEPLLGHLTKYNDEIISASFNNLAERGMAVNSTLGGILISSKVEKINKYGNNIKITIEKYRSPLGMYGITYKVKFKDNKWDIKSIDMYIS